MTIKINFTKQHLLNFTAWFGYLFMVTTIGFCVCNVIYWVATGNNIDIFGNPRLGVVLAVSGFFSVIILLIKLK